MKAEAVGSRASQWGEGPVWWENALWYVDIEGHALIRFDPESGEESTREVDQRIGFIRPCVSGKWIWGGDQGLYFLDPETGVSTHITDPEPELPANRFNDAGTSPDGHLFAGTIATDKTEGAAALYHLTPKQSLSTAYSGVTNSNGIAWSPSGSSCYYIDTPTRKVLRFDYQNGSLTNPRVLVNTDPVIDASPDGMCVDTDGHIWIAFCHGGCVIRFDHQTGQELSRITVPCRETTACTFGGPGLTDLYITTGTPGSDPEPDAGRVFVVKGVGATGQGLVPFADVNL